MNTPIIIGGCHRSGTTLLRYLFDRHPRLHAGPELPWLREVIDGFGADDPYAHLRLARTARAYLPDDAVIDHFGRLAIAVHEDAVRRAGKARWVDKHPLNARHPDRWQRLLGDAWHFVHVLRDPVDTIASIDEAGFAKSLPPDLDGRIDHWIACVETAEAWVAAHPDRAVRVRYEDLVTRPRETLATLMTALGESLHPDQLTYTPDPRPDLIEDPKTRRHTAPHPDSIGLGPARLGPEATAHIQTRTRQLFPPRTT